MSPAFESTQAECVVIEAERAEFTSAGAFNTGGVECAKLLKKDAKISATFSLAKTLKASVWVRVYYTWGGNDAINISFDGGEPLTAHARNDRSGRWDNGNFQVWHWHRAGEVELAKGKHTVTLTPLRGAGERIDKIVLYTGQTAWQEPWLTGDLSSLASKKTRYALTETAPLVIEAEDFDHFEAQLVRETATLTFARITEDAARVAVLFDSAKPVRAKLYLRQYFEAKNMFEGYSMEEMAENCYVELDGELIWTFFEQDGRRWHWRRAGIGAIDVPAGKHLLSITKQGSPVRLDKIAIIPEAAASSAAEALAPVPHLLPFELANEVPFGEAARISDWRLFGPLARGTKGQFLGEKDGAVRFPMRIDLPRDKGLLVLEKLKPQQSWEARAHRDREQRIALPVRGGQGLKLSVVYHDKNGERFLAALEGAGPGAEWSTASHMVPLDSLGTRGTYFDGTGELTRGSMARQVFGKQTDSAPPLVRYEGHAADGVPDYPLAATHIVIEKTKPGKLAISIAEPVFDSPFSVRAEVAGTIGAEETTTTVTIRVQVTSEATVATAVPLHYRIEPLHYDFEYGLAARRTLTRRVIEVGAGKTAPLQVSVTVGNKDVRRFIYAVGQSGFKTLFFGGKSADKEIGSVMSQLEARHGAYHATILRKNGKKIPRAEVASLYGRPDGFRILVDGLDVTSREYADKMDYAHRLEARGYDLSNGAGWPAIRVPYGIVAADPELGRIKFAEGDRAPLSAVGRSDMGFAVCGHGAPVIRGNYAIVPPGEGNHTVVDISDIRNPKTIAFLPSWYFSRAICPYRGRAYVESSRRGLMMVDGYLDNPYRPGPLRSIDFDRQKHGRFAHVFEEEGVAVSLGGGALWFHDLSDPYLPKEIARIDKIGGFRLLQGSRLAFVYAGDEIKAVDVSNPRKPRLMDTALERPKGEVGRKKQQVSASLAAAGEGWLALRLGPKFLLHRWEAKRQALVGKRSLSFQSAGEIEIPKGCGKHVITAFHKGYFYVLDGKGGPGQYGLWWGGPKSRWFVYEVKNGATDPVFTWEEPTPTAYGSVTIEGDYAYVNDYNYGLWIFDLSNPAQPVKISGAPTGGEGDACWTNGRFVYIWQTFGGHLFPIDVTDPRNPVRRGCYWDGAWVSYDNRFRGSYTISGTGNCVFLPKSRRALLAIDCTNPEEPKCTAEFKDKDGKPLVVGGACVHAVDDRAYVVRRQRKPPSELLVYDVSVPTTPKLVTTFGVPVATTLYKKGGILYLAGGKTLCLVSVANDKPHLLSTIDLNEQTKEGQMIGGITVTRGHAYLTSRDRAPITRMYVLDVSDTAKPRFVGLIDPVPDYMDAPCSSSWGDFYQDILSDGHYLFVGNYAQIECYDVSRPDWPKFVGRKPLGYQWSCGQKWGEYLYVPGLATMTVLDVPTSSQIPTGKISVK